LERYKRQFIESKLPQEVQNLIDKYKKLNIRLNISSFYEDNWIVLGIIIPPELRRQKYGSIIFSELFKLADKYHVIINLESTPLSNVSNESLKSFYNKIGFLSDKEKNKLHGSSRYFIRYPK